MVYPDKTAVVHGERRSTYAELYARCRRLAGALAGRGVGIGDTVSLMAPNVPEMPRQGHHHHHQRRRERLQP